MNISNDAKVKIQEIVKEFLLVESGAEEKFEIMLYDLGLNAVQMVEVEREIKKLTVNVLENAVAFIIKYSEIIQGEKAGIFSRLMA